MSTLPSLSDVLRAAIVRIRDIYIFDAPTPRQAFDQVRDVPDPEGEVMRRTCQAPILDKRPYIRRKTAACIRVPRWRNRTRQRFPLRNDKFETSPVGLRKANIGDRAVFQLKRHSDTCAPLAVVHVQPPEHGASLRDPDVMGAVLSFCLALMVLSLAPVALIGNKHDG